MPTLPTPLNDGQWQALVVATVGDLNGIVQTNITTLWAAYGQYEANPLLHYLRVRRAATELLMGAVWQQVTKAVGAERVDYSDRHKALLASLADIDAQIVTQQKGANLPQVGVMTTTEPVPPLTTPQVLPSGPPDPADLRYLGWPLSGRGYTPQ